MVPVRPRAPNARHLYALRPAALQRASGASAQRQRRHTRASKWTNVRGPMVPVRPRPPATSALWLGRQKLGGAPPPRAPCKITHAPSASPAVVAMAATAAPAEVRSPPASTAATADAATASDEDAAAATGATAPPQVRGLLHAGQLRRCALVRHGPAPHSRQARRRVLGSPPGAQGLGAGRQGLLQLGLLRGQVAPGLGARATALLGRRERAHAGHLRQSAGAGARASCGRKHGG